MGREVGQCRKEVYTLLCHLMANLGWVDLVLVKNNLIPYHFPFKQFVIKLQQKCKPSLALKVNSGVTS